MAAPVLTRKVTCRILRRNGELCTAEALDPDGEVLICAKHAARVMRMLPYGRRTAA